MSGEEVNRYLALLDRKLFIVAHFGVEWKPEYGPEMEAINQELAKLRKLVDQEHERRREEAAGAKEQGCRNGGGKEAVMEQLRSEALQAQREASEWQLHEVYGKAEMAWELGAITREGFLEISHMMVMNTDQGKEGN